MANAARAKSTRVARGDRAPSRRPRPTGAQRVYAALRRAIVVLDIEPGSPLEEERLCRHYKVSRTPLREALIRLASEGLVELEPNHGAKVAALQFADVVDHYEAMDVMQPVIWHFAAMRRTDADLDAIRRHLTAYRAAVGREDAEGIIQCNYDVHGALGAACHNRSLDKAYRSMLVDKLRVAQHAARGLSRDRGHVLAQRLGGAVRLLEQLLDAITAGDGARAETFARDYNAHVRQQIIEILSTSLAGGIKMSVPVDQARLSLARCSSEEAAP